MKATRSILKKLTLCTALLFIPYATTCAAEKESNPKVFEPSNEQEFAQLLREQAWTQGDIAQAFLSVYLDTKHEFLVHRNSQVDSNNHNTDNSNNVQDHVRKSAHEDIIAILKNRDICLKIKNSKGTEDILVLGKKLDPLKLLSKIKLLEQYFKNSLNYSLLHFAARVRPDLAKRLVTLLPGEVKARDNLGRTPLHFAALFGHLTTLKFLLKAGANKDARDYKGNSILHFAAAHGQLDVVQFLVNQDIVPIEVQDSARRTPLHFAATFGHLTTLKFLLEAGANKDVRDDKGSSILHFAAANGQLDIVQFLVTEHIISIEVQNSERKTPLHDAALFGHLTTLKFLLEAGANKDARDDKGNSILHYAARNDQLDVVQFLVNQDIVPIEVQNNHGQTPLHLAAKNGELTILKFLFEAGANSDTRDNQGNSILHYAAANGQLDVVQFLVTGKITLIDSQNSYGHTPLHFAATRGHLAILKFLLDSGANKDACDNQGNSILHQAAQYGHYAILEYLLKNDRSGINNANRNNFTPLESAIRSKALEAACTLLRAGAQYGHQHIQQIVQHGNFKDSIWGLLPHIFSQPAEKQFQWHSALHKRALKKINNTYNWIKTPEGRAHMLISLLPAMNQQPIPYFKKARTLLSQHFPQDLVRELCQFSAIPWRDVDEESHGNKRSHDHDEDIISPPNTKKQRIE